MNAVTRFRRRIYLRTRTEGREDVSAVLQEPALSHAQLIECLQTAYDLPIERVEFLPLGADVDTAVYRAYASTGVSYFVKLRRGELFRPAILVPRLLSLTGLSQVIPPIETVSGRLWTELNEYSVVLHPFIDGKSGFDRKLTPEQWLELGTALNQLHSSDMPSAIVDALPREEYSPMWRARVRDFQALIERKSFNDPAAAGVADLMQLHKSTIDSVVTRAEQLAAALRTQSPAQVLCHGDIHAGNVLLDQSGAIYIVDWDTLCLAPKERDLMFIGAGIVDTWNTPEEASLFYKGYGQTDVNSAAISYYRYERIVQDIAEFCQQLLLTSEGGEDRQQSQHYFASQFQSGGVVEIAFATDTQG